MGRPFELVLTCSYAAWAHPWVVQGVVVSNCRFDRSGVVQEVAFGLARGCPGGPAQAVDRLRIAGLLHSRVSSDIVNADVAQVRLVVGPPERWCSFQVGRGRGAKETEGSLQYPLLAEPIVLPAWLLIPTIIFLIAPMLNDAIVYRHHGLRYVARYSILSMILYGSMFTTSLITSAKSSIGGSVFLVTPKETERVKVRQALTLTRKEQGFFITLVTVSMITTQSVWPVALIVIPALFSICLTMMHNKRQIEPTSRHKGSLVRDSSQSKAG